MLFARILRDRKGGVAPMLALAIIPLIGGIGAAVDYSRANLVRTAMQSALDSSALMLSKDAQTLSSAELAAKATSYFNAMFQRPEASNVQVTQEFSSPVQGNFNLKVNGTATVNTMFWRLLGQEQINITASGEVTWGIKKLNLALALDNTGSMSSANKMTELKAAAHNLLTTLKKAEKAPGDIKVSIVPFAVDVNVGTSNVNADWIDWTDWEANNGTCSKSSYSSSQSNCTSHSGVWTPKAHSIWNGCVMDRDQNNDVMNTATAAGSPAVKYRAHQASACPAAMMPLSYDWTALNSKIDAMTPTGNTNVTIGLQIGWQTLSPVAPFNAPAAGARSRQGPHRADRRHQHAEPMDVELNLDRRAHAKGLRQCQGRQHPNLYGARDRRQRDAAEGLREQARDVLRGPAIQPAQQRVRLDRAEPRQFADRKIGHMTARAP